MTITYTLENIVEPHELSVTFKESNVTVTTSAGSGGSISPSGANSYAIGSSPTFTITPSAGQVLDTILVNGTVTTPTTTSPITIVIPNIQANTTINVSFKADVPNPVSFYMHRISIDIAQPDGVCMDFQMLPVATWNALRCQIPDAQRGYQGNFSYTMPITITHFRFRVDSYIETFKKCKVIITQNLKSGMIPSSQSSPLSGVDSGFLNYLRTCTVSTDATAYADSAKLIGEGSVPVEIYMSDMFPNSTGAPVNVSDWQNGRIDVFFVLIQ